MRLLAGCGAVAAVGVPILRAASEAGSTLPATSTAAKAITTAEGGASSPYVLPGEDDALLEEPIKELSRSKLGTIPHSPNPNP